MKATATNKSRRRRDKLFYWLLLAFPVLQFCVFYIGVNFNSFFLAFKSYDPLSGQSSFAGFSVFKEVLYDLTHRYLFKAALRNSLIAYVSTTLLGMSLALVFSYYIFKKQFGAKAFKVVLFLPSIIPSIVLVTVFLHFADSAIPALYDNKIMGLLTDLDTQFPTILFYNLWIGFGTSILMYVGAMNGISESVFEAARLDGASPLQEFFKIVLPMIYPTLTVFVTVGIAGIFTNQLNIFSFFGSSARTDLYTFGYYLYREVQGASTARYPYLSALGLLMTLVAAPLTLLIRTAMEKWGPSAEARVKK